MVYFEVGPHRQINQQLAQFEQKLETTSLKILITHQDYNNGSLFITVGSLIKTEDELALELACECFGSISIDSLPNY
jgi:hypothetical protein